MNDAYITIAIAALDSQVEKVSLPSPQIGINFLIVVQGREYNELYFASRADVTVINDASTGLSSSRNLALRHTNSVFVVFSDYDIIVDIEGLNSIANILNGDPAIDFAIGWRREHLKNHGKIANTTQATLANTGRVCAPEFLIRRSSFAQKNIVFDTEFGVGSRFATGEDFIFITDAIKAGLRGLMVPTVTGSHPGQSTGNHWHRPELIFARGVVIRRVFGWKTVFVAPLYLAKHRRKFMSVKHMWGFLCGAMKLYD